MPAPKKPAPKKAPAKAPAKKPTLAARKTTRAKRAGYESAGAQASVTRQYGMVKNDAGAWVKPDAAFLERQMAAQGWGVGQPVATPVNVGGARWLTGAGGLEYTGERSDAARRGPGAAAGAEGQTAYSAAGYGAPGKGGRKRKGKGKGQGSGGHVPGGGLQSEADGAAAAASAFIPYAEADVATTSYRRAQGKAYGQGRGSSLAGGTSSPKEAKEAASEGSAVVGKGKKKGRGKKKAVSRRSAAGRRKTARAKKK